MDLRETLQAWAMGLVVVVLMLWGTTLQAAVPAAWKDSGYAMNADNMTVRAVLDEFGHAYGVRIQMAGNGERRVKGRLKAESGIDFLNRLAAANNLRWFVYNGTLYVGAATDNTSLRIQVGENAVQDAKNALVGLGLYDERFGWGELPDDGVVIVSGPRAYVDLARDVLMPPAGEKEKLRGRQVMLFRLKYASAMDRTINSRGKSETVPGIRTILTNLMLGGHGGSAEKVTGTGGFDAASTKRTRTGKNGRADAREAPQEGGGDRFVPLFSAPAANGRNAILPGGANGAGSPNAVASYDDDGGHRDGYKEPPRIEADPTLNAIMIYDDVAKRGVYQSLIDQLDVKPQQVEIEALIVDIDRSKLAEMGVEWGARTGAVETIVNGTTTQSSGTNLPLPGATLLISNAGRFYARLKAMESNGEARVLATPTVLTLDNVAAVLDLSQSAYVSLVGERVADMSDITAGTMLRVIPRIIDDNGNTRVRLEVDIEDGSLNTADASGSSSSGANVLGTSVTRSTINTQAIIDAQQTLMIGGYRAESLIRNRQKVPVLGDIPLVGGLFRSESKSTSTRERLFLITPRITGFDGARVAKTPPTPPPPAPPMAPPPVTPVAAPAPRSASAAATPPATGLLATAQAVAALESGPTVPGILLGMPRVRKATTRCVRPPGQRSEAALRAAFALD